ncbi:MAG: peptide ABC transporter substrate-binding protein [Candidatus Dormibacteraceae bacterium]
MTLVDTFSAHLGEGTILSSMRWAGKMAGVAVMVIFLAGCGGPPSSITLLKPTSYRAEPGIYGGKLVYSDWGQLTDLNLLANPTGTSTQASDALWSRLWGLAPDNQPVPDLVTEIPTLQNGMLKQLDDTHMDLAIQLKSGLRWSDGQSLTTADVKFTWEAICDPATGAYDTVGYDHISSMEIKSPTEMIWHFGPNPKGFCGLSQPLSNGLYAPYLSNPIAVLPKHVLDHTSHSQWAQDPYFTRKPTVTSGPYEPRSFVPGSPAQLVMQPNPHYLDGRKGSVYFAHRPYLDQLIYKIYGDKAAQINGLGTGDSDLALDMSANDLPALRGSGDQVKVDDQLGDEMVLFNTANNTTDCAAQHFAQECGHPTPWKDDPTLRQALGLSVDKAALVSLLVGGLGKVMNSPYPSDFDPWYDPHLPAFHYDLNRTNQLLDQDGWRRGAGGIRSKAGRRLQFTLSTTSGSPERAAEEELLITGWKKVGAEVSTANYSGGELFNSFKGGGILSSGQYDASLFTSTFKPDPDGWSSLALISKIPTIATPIGQNYGRWSDKRLNDLFLTAESELDPRQRIDDYKEIQQEWLKYQGAIELYQYPKVSASRSKVGNFDPGLSAPSLGPWNIADWFRGG